MPHIRNDESVDLALALSDLGLIDRENAAVSGVAIKTIRRWRRLYQRGGIARGSHVYPCPFCDGRTMDNAAYAHLLGWYLCDGSISTARTSYLLSIINDETYPGLNDEIADLIGKVRGGLPTAIRKARGAVRTESKWAHWPCLFPQHGPGRKHTRPITLEPWQREIVDDHPWMLLRGMFHADGCRSINRVRRSFASGERTYGYPRWFFSNESTDILAICCRTLEQVGIHWTQCRPNMIAVSRTDDVQRMDEFVGVKY